MHEVWEFIKVGASTGDLWKVLGYLAGIILCIVFFKAIIGLSIVAGVLLGALLFPGAFAAIVIATVIAKVFKGR
ncbi:MAG: hypothetical protein II837_17220 [Treponema sp.]|nr:hypothetical protein [Treponema sp.]